MQRSALLSLAALLALAVPTPIALAADQLAVSEPNHVVGYLPLYVAQKRGFFAEENIEVKWTTIENGAGPTNALLTNRSFAVLGGPEHNAFAKIKGADLKAIGGVVMRASVYVTAVKGKAPASPPKTNSEWASYLKGKRIGVGAFSSTPNSVLRYLLAKFGLDPKRDVQLHEMASVAIVAAAKAGQIDIAVLNEPLVTQGIRGGLWGEPIYNVPRELGPYAWTTVNVRGDTVEKQPQLVERFLRAMLKGLKATYSDHAQTIAIAKQEFPTMAVEDLTSAIDRTLKDELWSKDGTIDPQSWDTAQTVAMEAGLLKQKVPYADVIDTRFVKR